MGGMKISQLTMAVATSAKYVPTGIMGIGFSAGESIVMNNGTDPYPSIIDELVSQALINTRAYSLWLNDLSKSFLALFPHHRHPCFSSFPTPTPPLLPPPPPPPHAPQTLTSLPPPDSNTGTILFGGYDTAKFKPPLIALPIQPDFQSGNITSMTLAWTSLSLTSPTSGTGTLTLTPASFAAPTILDSGTTLTGLPAALYTPLAAFFDAVNDAEYGTLVSCTISTSPGTLNYGFGGPGGPVISVPFYELAIPATDARGDPVTFRDGSPACLFGLFAVDDGQSVVFGDTFLRSAYVLYDLDRREIAIAPTVFNTSDSHIVAISKAATGPRSVGEGVTALQTATGVGALGIAPTATATVVGSAPRGGVGDVRGLGTVEASTTATKTSAAGMVAVPALDTAVVVALVGMMGMMLMGGAFLGVRGG